MLGMYGNRKIIDKLYNYHIVTDSNAEMFASCKSKKECLSKAYDLMKENDTLDEVAFIHNWYLGKHHILNNTKKNIYVYRYEFPELVKSCDNCFYKNKLTGECECKLPKKLQGSDKEKPCYDDYSGEYYAWKHREYNKE